MCKTIPYEDYIDYRYGDVLFLTTEVTSTVHPVKTILISALSTDNWEELKQLLHFSCQTVRSMRKYTTVMQGWKQIIGVGSEPP